MSALAASLSAQIGAELKMRLRSFATPIALAAFFAASILWIPDPKGKSVTMSWTLADGRIQSPIYTAGYVGLAAAVLACIFLTLGGFYLVAGSVRRDRESKVGAILAATPLSKAAYLGGKVAAHVVYLFVLSLLALAAGAIAFLRFGVGPFDAVAFALPYLVLSFPAIAAVAVFAVFFDVTPGLRSRGGLVIWFFFFAFGLVKLPMDLAGEAEGKPGSRLPVFDPAGVASDQWLVRRSVPEEVTGVSTGHITHSKPVERVPWKGLDMTPEFLGMRAVNVAMCAIPFALAVLIFDRFDPARGRRRLKKPKKQGVRSEIFGLSENPKKPDLTPVTARPTAGRAILAEARLIWESASLLKWPLAIAAILAGLLPGNFAQGAFLLLLVPVISEVAARETLAGTRSLVYSQPGVPASPVLWKTAALGLFVVMLGTPMTIHGFAQSPARGLACLAGLLAVAAVCVGLGSLSLGGKLFSGVYLVVWYMGMSGMPEADFTGALSKAPSLMVSLLYLALGGLLVAAATGRERLRRA